MTAAHTTPMEVPAAGTYRIDPQRSTVSYSGRHMFGLGVVHATFTIRSGEVRIAGPPTGSSVTVSIGAGSFTSNNPKRDKDVRSAGLLDTATYPDITFTADTPREDDGGRVLPGAVTAHGSMVGRYLDLDLDVFVLPA